MARPITTAGTTLAETDPRRKYTDVQVDEALVLLSILGQPTKVQAELRRQWGYAPGEFTIRYWRDHSYADRYLEIRRDVVPKIRARLAAKHEDIQALALERAEEALVHLDVYRVPQDELAKTVQQLSVSSGIHSDKASLLRGMPTEIVGHMDVDENLDAIARLAPGLVVDGTATELPEPVDAEVVD